MTHSFLPLVDLIPGCRSISYRLFLHPRRIMNYIARLATGSVPSIHITHPFTGSPRNFHACPTHAFARLCLASVRTALIQTLKIAKEGIISNVGAAETSRRRYALSNAINCTTDPQKTKTIFTDVHAVFAGRTKFEHSS